MNMPPIDRLTWDTLCECGHPMSEHILDWDARNPLEPDCTRSNRCQCPEFNPVHDD